jgi:site-specific recombinase XerD
MTIQGKNGQVRWAGLSERCHRLLRAYMKVRPRGACQDFWLKRDGERLGDWGIESTFRRIKAHCGIPRFHAHLLRHTFGTHALRKGAERAMVKDLLGHQSDLMTLRYTREERKRSAAKAMPRYSTV